MEIITENKTTTLIKKSAEEQLYIVCPRSSDVIRIKKTAREMSLKIPEPLTFKEFIDGEYYTPSVKGFLFDDIDRSIQVFSRVPIVALSLSDNRVESNCPQRSPRTTEYVASCINQDGSVDLIDATPFR